jgi:hypothetical protein
MTALATSWPDVAFAGVLLLGTAAVIWAMRR